MANYPDWVLKHKKKGTYVNKVGDKYYLYAAHSERVPGTDKVKRVSDGYLGRITEKDGFIPTKAKVKGDVMVYEYGLSSTIVYLCSEIFSGLKREFKTNADYVAVVSMLNVMYGRLSISDYEGSILCINYPGTKIMKPPTDKQAFAIERTQRMIRERLNRHFGEEVVDAMKTLQHFYKVRINGKLYLSAPSSEAIEVRKRYKLLWKEDQ